MALQTSGRLFPYLEHLLFGDSSNLGRGTLNFAAFSALLFLIALLNALEVVGFDRSRRYCGRGVLEGSFGAEDLTLRSSTLICFFIWIFSWCLFFWYNFALKPCQIKRKEKSVSFSYRGKTILNTKSGREIKQQASCRCNKECRIGVTESVTGAVRQ